MEFLDFKIPPSEFGTLQTLCKIQLSLILKYPYENLSVFHGIHKPQMDLVFLRNKLIGNKAGERGGFCLELNAVLYNILKQTGFEGIRRLSGNVILGLEDHTQKAIDKPDTHILLIVKCKEGKEYISDIGASELAAMEPLEFKEGAIAEGAGGKVLKLVKGTWLDQDRWIVQMWDKNKHQQEHYINFFVFNDIPKEDEHFQLMLTKVNRPEICPPFPYGLEYITKPDQNYGRWNAIGSPSSGYTFFHRDRSGTEDFKLKVETQREFKDEVKKRFRIDIDSFE